MPSIGPAPIPAYCRVRVPDFPKSLSGSDGRRVTAPAMALQLICRPRRRIIVPSSSIVCATKAA
jgi:hypothetical protein